MPADPSFLLYDRDCRICAAAARFVRFLARDSGVRVRTLQESSELLASLPAGEVLESARFVSWDGRLLSGGDVIPATAAALTGAHELEALLQASPATRAAVHRAYAGLVALRGRLTCRVPPSV